MIRSCNVFLGLTFVATAAVSAQSTLRGVVIDPSGNPVREARVAIEKLMLTATAGAAGEFSFTTVPSGRFVVLTRAIGFAPDRRELRFTGADTVLVEIRLEASAQRLDSLVTTVDAPKTMSPQMRAFEERRKAGFGRFLTRDQLRLREHSSFVNVLRSVTGLRLVRRPEKCGGGFALAGARGGDLSWFDWMVCHDGTNPFPVACYLTIYLDGVRIWTWGTREPIAMDDFNVNAFEGIEIYRGPAELPVQFQATGSSCGSMLLWTRTGESP